MHSADLQSYFTSFGLPVFRASALLIIAVPTTQRPAR